MAKYFSNINIWNPTIMRLELEIAVAKHMARFERDQKYVVPLDKLFRENTRNNLDGRKMKDYLSPYGDVPASSGIWRILHCIRLITDSDSNYTENDIYMLGLFLDEKTSIKVNDTIDEIKENAKSKYNGVCEKYYVLVYKRLYRMRSQLELTFQDWYLVGSNKGLRSTSLKNLRIFTIKSLDQSIRNYPDEAWEKMIFKDDNSGLLPSLAS